MNEFRARMDQVTQEWADYGQDELGRTHFLQYAKQDRYPIPMYSGDMKTLPEFQRLLFFWALSRQPEDALKHYTPIDGHLYVACGVDS